MSTDPCTHRDELRQAADRIAVERYAARADALNVAEQAAQAKDCEYLLAWSRYLEADRDLARTELLWLSPEQQKNPRESLRRIRDICACCDDLYPAVQAVLATHQSVSRSILAAAIKSFRRDIDPLSVEDVTGLLVAAWNGGQQGFDAVLRTRKGGERKPVALPWATSDE